MSTSSTPFENGPVFGEAIAHMTAIDPDIQPPALRIAGPSAGLVPPTSGQYTSAPTKATRTLDGDENRVFIEKSFRQNGIQNGDALRTLLQSVLGSFWWKRRDVARMPRQALDPFVQRQPDGTGICRFCMSGYGTVEGALDCVKEHIDM